MLSVLAAAAAWLAPTPIARGATVKARPVTAPAQATTAPSAASATPALRDATTAPVTSARAAAANANGNGNPHAHSDWSQTVNRLAALLASTDLIGLQGMLQPSPVIRPFGSDALQTHERLLGATTGSTVLGVHAYDQPPTTLASDLANDFSAAGDAVPVNVREGMVPRDPDAARRANDTARQWLAHVLQPREGEVLGVIVLWPPTRGRSIASAPKRATFVLVKGEKVDGAYVLRQITFGDPLESPQ